MVATPQDMLMGSEFSAVRKAAETSDLHEVGVHGCDAIPHIPHSLRCCFCVHGLPKSISTPAISMLP